MINEWTNRRPWFEAAMRSTAGDAAWMDEPVQQRRDDVEWGRWMETDKAHWVRELGRPLSRWKQG